MEGGGGNWDGPPEGRIGVRGPWVGENMLGTPSGASEAKSKIKCKTQNKNNPFSHTHYTVLWHNIQNYIDYIYQYDIFF